MQVPKPQKREKKKCLYCSRPPGKDGLCFSCRGRKKAMGRVRLSPKPKKKAPTGEAKLFDKIAAERGLLSEVSRQSLYDKGEMFIDGNDMYYAQFSHLLTKSAFPNFRLNPDNIMLMTYEEHRLWEHYRQECVGPQWDKVRKKEEELKTSYFK